MLMIFEKMLKKCRPRKNHLPSKVDEKQDPISISSLFKDKFEDLFNSVSFNKADLDKLMHDIDNSINDYCNTTNDDSVFLFNPNNVSKAISKLKVDKRDGSLPLTSDNLINSTEILNGHLALLFSAMVRHGFSPDGMLAGTMVPLPKGR